MNKKFILGLFLVGYYLVVLHMQQHCQQQILYDNTNSGITSTNVQGAIDELYTKANSNSYDEYTGSTTYTPSEFVQTIELVTSTLSTNCVGVVYNHAANT